MIPINKPQIDDDERQEILKVLDEGILTSASNFGGKRVQDFERLLADFLHVKHAIAVNSGTAALHASILAAGIKESDEILIPSFTFVATANSVACTGAKPVFVDIEKDTYTMDPLDLENKITKKTRAIIPVHLYGHPAKMDEIKEIANKHSIIVIEDACQSLGSTYDGKQTGSLGQMGCFSMYASKVLTSGEGGAITTDSDEFAEKLRMIRNHGMVSGYDTRIIGFNMRLPEISAAIAKTQMKKIQSMLDKRASNARKLGQLLSNKIKDKNIVLPHENQRTKYNWYLYTVALNDSRDKVKKFLNDSGIGATIYYDPPVHQTPFYSKFYNRELEITEWASKSVLSLPVHPSITEKDLDFMANKVEEAI
ncbi:MAG: DegT/DnrJ/EryC1/StrS family aminotransferase [Nitrososphaeraceae archaeon]|jgi:perosamine synthetase|nr:DegT/DnrJ/EryC1/StrS family aminotransferase [Nitrososphaeraceae archaeon]MDW0173213.1 DegT/DnrJ/EryC1/StrS family aminotransferase [Nitrososphaeraceae archaeon]MDW0177400.1 DegT/DnrJ/EryC1/StrS family aminotransferase [Nitrososphaeraceae archaeon]MDW0181041.1 DegT/DnrJ/EryC1/StrS family aminotransferase [Nitrososphaeraceae archaeon]MDW0193449.1 DegT/DnrJ/EryC1/StrS family aminotransferase [Nitrososphaeraceae archaeon]